MAGRKDAGERGAMSALGVRMRLLVGEDPRTRARER